MLKIVLYRLGRGVIRMIKGVVKHLLKPVSLDYEILTVSDEARLFQIFSHRRIDLLFLPCKFEPIVVFFQELNACMQTISVAGPTDLPTAGDLGRLVSPAALEAVFMAKLNRFIRLSLIYTYQKDGADKEIEKDQVLYAEGGDKETVFVQTNGARETCPVRIDEIAPFFPRPDYVWISGAVLVNMGYLKEINQTAAVLTNGQTLPVDPDYRIALLRETISAYRS